MRNELLSFLKWVKTSVLWKWRSASWAPTRGQRRSARRWRMCWGRWGENIWKHALSLFFALISLLNLVSYGYFYCLLIQLLLCCFKLQVGWSIRKEEMINESYGTPWFGCPRFWMNFVFSTANDILALYSFGRKHWVFKQEQLLNPHGFVGNPVLISFCEYFTCYHTVVTCHLTWEGSFKILKEMRARFYAAFKVTSSKMVSWSCGFLCLLLLSSTFTVCL